MDPSARSDRLGQIRLINRLADLMTGMGIEFWLSGGWAVDFHLGRVTRSHSDIDVVVALSDKTSLLELLDREGAVHARSDEAGGVESFDLDDSRIEITYILEDDNGNVVTPGYESWPWPEDSFPDEGVTMATTTLRAVSAAALLDMKEGWEEHLGEKPRVHDVADIQALRALLNRS